MKKFLQFCFVAAILLGCSTQYVAASDFAKGDKAEPIVLKGKTPGVFNSLAVGVGVGTTGVDFNVAMPIGRHFAIRGGVDMMPNFTFNSDLTVSTVHQGAEIEGDMSVEAGLKRTSGEVLLNYYPFKRSSFFLTAGAYFGGDQMIKVAGHSDSFVNGSVIVGDQRIPVDENGNVSGGLRVKNVRPYVGIGMGRIVPRRRVGFMWELGVQIHGTPEVYTDFGDVSSEVDAALANNDFQDIIDKVVVYPTLKFRINIRLF